MICTAEHPETGQVCRLTGDHAEHFAGRVFLDNEISWPNEDYVAPAAPGPRGRVKQHQVLAPLAARVREADAVRAKASVDRNVAPLAGDARETSVIAASRALPKTGTRRRQVYDFISERGDMGATDDEMIRALGLLHQSETPARYSLMKDGLIVDSGLRRNTRQGNPAIVWVVSTNPSGDTV